MSALWNLLLLPLALPFRWAAAQPWPAIIISGVASVACYWIGQDIIGFILVSYMSYVMIWVDEKTHPRAIDEGVVAGD